MLFLKSNFPLSFSFPFSSLLNRFPFFSSPLHPFPSFFPLFLFTSLLFSSFPFFSPSCSFLRSIHASSSLSHPSSLFLSIPLFLYHAIFRPTTFFPLSFLSCFLRLFCTFSTFHTGVLHLFPPSFLAFWFPLSAYST